MKQFNVINFDFNAKKFEAYDVIPYLVRKYKERVDTCNELEQDLQNATSEHECTLYRDSLKYWKVPVTFDEFREFVKSEGQYQFWSRCEYEIILVDWPCQKTEEKWDVYDQIMMNIDIVTQIVMEETVLCVTE